jgi:tetratricopeptide (TPR) repeat protein
VKKEVVVFLVTLLLLAGLYFMGSDGGAAAGQRGRGKAVDPQPPIAAKRIPGTFVPETEVTWAPNASNIFETPSETKDLPPLDVAPPPAPRLIHPGVPLPIALNQKARSLLRRVIVPVAQPGGGGQAAAPGSNGGGGAVAAADQKPADAVTTQPSDPLFSLDRKLSAFESIKLTLEQEKQREAEQAKAKQSEEERKKSLDTITLAQGNVVMYGEIVPAPGSKESRYVLKRTIDQLRVDPALTEPERNDRLKKIMIGFREDKRGKLGKPLPYSGDNIQSLTFADTAENRYRQRALEVGAKDVAGQIELAKIVFDARHADPKNLRLAAEHLAGMRKAGVMNAESTGMLADALHQLHDYNQEADVLRQAAKDFPDSAPLLARHGRLLSLLGLTDDARAAFQAALAKNQTEPLANAGLAEILLKAGDAKGASGYLREALSQATDPAKVDAIRLLLAEAYVAQGDFKNAHETLDLVLARTSAAPGTARLFERASTLSTVAAMGQNNFAEARNRAEEGVKRHPLSGQLSLLLGMVLLQQGELANARTRIQNAMELDPLLTGHAMLALAAVDEASADDSAAVTNAEAGAVTANPSASELKLPYGRALFHVGDLGRAQEQLLLALDADPRSPDILAALGDVEYASGRLVEAMRFYDRAAALEPAFPQLLPRRIITQVRRRKLAEADELAAKAGTADLKDPFVQAAIAYLQYSKGNQAEALNSLQQLSEANAGALSAYAKDAHRRLVIHGNKEMWTDSFSRQGAEPGRGWGREIGAGVMTALGNNAVKFEGKQGGGNVVSDQPTLIWQERQGDKLFGFSVDLDLQPQPGVYAGVGLMVYNQTAKPERYPGSPNPAKHGGQSPFTGIQVALSPDGVLVHRLLIRGRMGDWKPLEKSTYTGGPVTIELRLANPKEGVVEVLVNRDSVLEQTMNDLKNFRRAVSLEIFCQAQIDRKVHFTADNVVIVTLKEQGK